MFKTSASLNVQTLAEQLAKFGSTKRQTHGTPVTSQPKIPPWGIRGVSFSSVPFLGVVFGPPILRHTHVALGSRFKRRREDLSIKMPGVAPRMDSGSFWMAACRASCTRSSMSFFMVPRWGSNKPVFGLFFFWPKNRLGVKKAGSAL